MELRRRIKQSFTQVPRVNNLDESPQKPEESLQGLTLTKNLLQTLTKKHIFLHHSKSGIRKNCVVYLSESLLKLFISKRLEKQILTTEIISVDKEISLNLRKSITEFNEKMHTMKIVTSYKVFIFSTEDLSLRDCFVNGLSKLVKLSKEFMGTMALSKYCECIIQYQINEVSLKTLQKSCRGIVRRQEVYKDKQKVIEFQIIAGVVSEIITKIEIDDKCEECNEFELEFKNNLSEYKSLTVVQETLQEEIRKTDLKCVSIQNLIQGAKDRVSKHLKRIGISSFGPSTNKIWLNIVQFLKSQDIFILLSVNTKVRKQTKKTLLVKPLWRVLCLGKFQPRKVFYKAFMANFLKSRFRGSGFGLNPSLLSEIHNDVWQGLSEFQAETEEILIKLCKYNPSLEYCQGMHFVSNFLFSIFRNTDEVVQTMDSLCRPPFYLSELWKNDFSRLKLGIYQLEFIMKIRLPLLFRHLKKLEIQLELIVSRWFLTVFTHLIFQFDAPVESVMEIWDFFLVHGWPALISACLCFFYVNEALVLDLDYEGTLMTLSTKTNFADIYKLMPKFEIDPRMLEDLDSSYASFY